MRILLRVIPKESSNSKFLVQPAGRRLQWENHQQLGLKAARQETAARENEIEGGARFS